MEENEIIKFREKAIAYFQPILENEGYSIEKAQELAFYVSKILEDTLNLFESIESNETDFDKVTSDIHLLFTNVNVFERGRKILMWEE